MPKAYYNEHDKSAAAWLRELIKEGVITDGEVDERSIEDVIPAELAEFDRCHFFAGIGVWDYALTRAGWPDGRRVWTGSCPCQPFSAAGKGDGFADERHLWPAWFHLIEQCRPGVVFGEQVSSKDTLPWIDLVHTDLEGALYTVVAADLCVASVGAPHIRQRLYFVANAERNDGQISVRQGWKNGHSVESGRRGGTSQLADAERFGCGSRLDSGEGVSDSRHSSEVGQQREVSRAGVGERSGGPGPTNGFWRDAEWIYCRDGKWRPVGTIESGTQPLADGLAADLGCVRDQSSGRYAISPLIEKGKGRVSRLRGYGNAIVAEVAVAWIESYLAEIEN